jgi:hypothetical protein
MTSNPNKRYPSIPDPSPTMDGLFEAVFALKQNVEIITGQRGKLPAGVTFEDLVRLGLINKDQVPK